MRKILVAFFVWLVVIGVGWAGSQAYTQYIARKRPTMQARVRSYEQEWQAVLNNVKAHAPPDPEATVAEAPLGQQGDLRQKLAQVDQAHSPTYQQKADRLLDELVITFEGEWQDALDAFTDTPSVDEFSKCVHEYHQARLRAKLQPVAESLQKKNPRTALALDSFSGYCVLRSDKFRARLTELTAEQDLNIKLHLMDDGADYQKRIQALNSGTAPLAVFTLDALINNSSLFDSPPAAVVLFIDETRGADAMVAYREALPNLEALNRPDLRIVLTPNSPSETLARLVRSQFKLPKLPKECYVTAEGPEEVYKRFQSVDPREPTAFVLWEPYVSKLLKQYPQAQVLIDSSRFSGYIVDVLVAQKAYLKEHPAEVKAVVQAYLEAAAFYRKAPGQMVKAVLEDSRKLVDAHKLSEALSDDEARQVVKGIAWKTTADNYAHFGLEGGGAAPGSLPPVEEMINNITTVLVKTRAISRPGKPEALFDKEVCATLRSANFNPDPPVATNPDSPPAGSTDEWRNLQPVGTLDVDPVPFDRGSSALSDDALDVLKEVAHKMKALPEGYLEVRGYARGDTPEDRDLAGKRAEAVAKWLQQNGGLDPRRTRAVPVDYSPSQEQSAVTFFLLQPPR